MIFCEHDETIAVDYLVQTSEASFRRACQSVADRPLRVTIRDRPTAADRHRRSRQVALLQLSVGYDDHLSGFERRHAEIGARCAAERVSQVTLQHKRNHAVGQGLSTFIGFFL